MGLNNRIGGAVDVLAPRTMEEALEKVVRQEHKIRKDNSIRDNKRKTTWIQRVLILDPRKDNLRTSSTTNQSQREMGLKMLKVISMQIRITRIMEGTTSRMFHLWRRPLC